MQTSTGVNATGNKPHYYSRNKRALDFGYQPRLTSVEVVIQEIKVLL